MWYGLRLFEVELRQGNGRKAVDVSNAGGEHLAELAERVLRDRLFDRTLVGFPDADYDGAGDAASIPEDERDRHLNKPGLRVEAVQRHGHTVIASVFYGRYGAFRRGLRAPGSVDPDPDLHGIAPARGYQVVLNLPPKGTRGVLAVEDISRSCPVTMFVRWLKWASQEHAADLAAAAHTGDPEAATKAAAKAVWWRLAVHPMADVEHLKRLVQQGRLERVQLIRKAVGADGTRSKAELELTVRNLSGRHELISDLMREWTRRKFRDPGDAAEEEAAVTDS